MRAGRELDALVAQNVLKWDVSDIYYDATHQEIMPRVPYYSTDMAAAWTVVKMTSDWRGFDFMLIREGGTNTWRAGWFEQSPEGPESRVSAYGDTAPLAICLAALEAAERQ